MLARLPRPVAPLFVLACAIAPFAIGLGGWALFEPDEGRNAEIAREMLASGDWVVPHLNGLPFLDKPPLLFWTIAASFRVFGESEWVARLPSMLGALATIAATYAIARALLGGRTAITAALVMATSPMLLIFGRLVIFDVPLTAFVTIAIYALVRARLDGDGWPWLPVAGGAIGLALLTKGPVGMVLPLLVWIAARGALPKAPMRRSRSAIAVAVALGAGLLASWIVCVAPREPDFLRYAIVDETFLRVTSTEHFRRGGPPYYYLQMLLWATGIWIAMLAMFGPTLVRRRRAGGRDAAAIDFAARAVAAILLFFTLSASKRPQYILPALVPLALLVAIGIAARPRFTATVVRRGGWIAAIVGAGVIVWLATGIAPLTVRAKFPLETMIWISAAVLLTWGIVTARLARRPRWAITCAAALGPLLFLSMLPPVATYAERRSARGLAARIPADVPVVCFDTYRTSLPFYLKRTVTVLSDGGTALTSNYVVSQRARLRGTTLRYEGALAQVLAASPRSYVIVGKRRVHEIRRMVPEHPLVVVDRDDMSALLAPPSARASGQVEDPHPTASRTGSAIPTSPPRTNASISSIRAPAS